MASKDGTKITPKELAAELRISDKRLRSQMRKFAAASNSATPGSGGRWAIDQATADTLRAYFANQHNRGEVSLVIAPVETKS